VIKCNNRIRVMKAMYQASAQTLHRVYTACIRPFLDYAAYCWFPATAKKTLAAKINRIQATVAKIILGLPSSARNDSSMLLSNLMPVEHRASSIAAYHLERQKSLQFLPSSSPAVSSVSAVRRLNRFYSPALYANSMPHAMPLSNHGLTYTPIWKEPWRSPSQILFLFLGTDGRSSATPLIEIKREFNRISREMWLNEQSEIESHLSQLGVKEPPARDPFWKLNRSQQRALSMARLGIIGLNYSDTAQCAICDTSCGHGYNRTAHIIFHCRRLQTLRRAIYSFIWQARRRLTTTPEMLRFLLFDEEAAAATADFFIQVLKRF
jgi:hypothetical protein